MALHRVTDLALWHRCLAAVATSRAGMPTTDTAVSLGSLSRQSYGTNGAGGPGISQADIGPSVLESLVECLAEEDQIAFRASIAPDGSAEVLLVDLNLPQLAGASPVGHIDGVVLTPDTLPEPYRRRPVAIDRPRSSHADPDTVRRIVRTALPDAPPTPPSTLAEAQRSVRHRLPDDVLAMYETAGSGYLLLQPGGTAVSYDEIDFESDEELHEMTIFDLGIPERSYCTAPARAYAWPHVATEVVMPDPTDRVQPLGHSPAWFLVGADTYGGYYVADLAPGPRGTYGQILHVTRESSMGARWVAPSLTEFLLHGDHPDADPYFGDVAPPTSVRIGDHTDQTMADVTPDTEVLHINAVSMPVDLTPLVGHPRLRAMAVTTERVVGLGNVLRTLPELEYLELPHSAWTSLVADDAVPARLAAAGFSGAPGDLISPVGLANSLLTMRGLEPVPITRLRADGTVEQFVP